MNAPATFQVFINSIFKEYINKFAVMYLNNILVYLRSEKDHIQHIRKVLQALQNTNLKVKLKKSYFHIKEVSFLEFIVFTEGLKMNLEKI